MLAGDVRAAIAFLQISQRRAKLNGLDSLTKIDLSSDVRSEMDRALADLQRVVLAGETEPLAED